MQNSISKFKTLHSEQVLSKERQTFFKGGVGYNYLLDDDFDGLPHHDDDFDGIP